MDELPYQPRIDVSSPAPLANTGTTTVPTDWRSGLPTLAGGRVTLRELRMSDGPSLLVSVTSAEVARFVSPPPASIEGFERFIEWSHRQRAAGVFACFAIVPRGSDTAIGIFQVRSLEPSFVTAEWGFVMGSDYWGTGIFVEGARLVVEFAFNVIGVHRLEARAAIGNGRGNGALRKIGATVEGLLRRSFLRDGEYHDEAMWTILRDEWRGAKATWGAPVVLH